MSEPVVIAVEYREWNRKHAAANLDYDPRDFDAIYGDLGFHPITQNGHELRVLHFRSTDIAKRSYENSHAK